MAFLARQLDRFLLQHWRWIDAQYRGKQEGRLSADARALVTLGVAALVLVFVQYVVLARGGLQRAVSLEVPALVRLVAPDLAALAHRYGRLLENLTWSVGCSYFYFVVPALVVKLVFRERLRDHGLAGQGFVRHLWIYAVLFTPVALLVWAVSYSEAFQSRYPFYGEPYALADFLVWEAAYAFQFFSLEFFFRGFLLNGLRGKIGHYAIFLMVLPYMMIHFQKPFLETVGAIIAGTVLGTLALRTRNIWGGVTIHVAVAISMDVAALLQKGGFPPLVG